MSLQGSSSSPTYLSHTDKLAASMQDLLLLAGRILLGWIFISSGWRKLMDIPGFVKTMPRRDLPELLGYIAPPVEFIGGVCLVAGLATRYASLLMLLFVIIATFSSHRYWNVTDPAQYGNQNSHFWKNVSMMGGLVLMFIAGAGRHALDRMLLRR
jgi:putative oxidoreductase